MIGSRSSTGWIPVARGLYSANSSAASTPSAASSASSRTGTGSPSGPKASRQPESWPNLAAHAIQAGLTVLSLGTCMWASTTASPSIIGIGSGPRRRSGAVEAPQAGPVPAGGLDVRLHRAGRDVAGDRGLLDLRGDAGDQGAGRDLEALWHQSGRRHDRAGADAGPVQGDGPGTDQAPVL